jgi:hypothetical protein
MALMLNHEELIVALLKHGATENPKCKKKHYVLRKKKDLINN